MAMLNLDMIGRVQGGKVFVSGAQTGTTLVRIMDEVKPPAPLYIDESGKNSGHRHERRQRSCLLRVEADSHFVFLLRVAWRLPPAQPSDTADKIDSVDAAKLLETTWPISRRIFATDPDRPTFVRVVLTGGSGTRVIGPRLDNRGLRAGLRQHSRLQ